MTRIAACTQASAALLLIPVSRRTTTFFRSGHAASLPGMLSSYILADCSEAGYKLRQVPVIANQNAPVRPIIDPS